VRVTNQMIGNALKQHIQNNLTRLSRTQEQMSTGKTILRPSDSPTDISHLMAVKAQREINKQYSQNIDDGLAYLYTADAALGTVGEMLVEANELAVQAANGTLTGDDMKAIGEQIDKMIDQMVDVANTTAGGKYIFAGRTNDIPPFYRDPNNPGKIMYRGDLERITREIANLSEHTVDAPGVTNDRSNLGVFGYINAVNPNGATVSDAESLPTNNNGTPDYDEYGLFDTLFKFKELLNNGDADKISDFIGVIQDQMDNVLKHRVAIGARTRHFEAAKEQMLDQEITLSQVLENIESADIARLSIDLSEQQLVYQASLASGANILQTSLLNFLK